MQVQVLLERTGDGKFRASGSLFQLVVEGTTEEEATRNYRDALASCLIDGGKVIAVDVPETEPSANGHPWMRFAGTLPDDELTRDWMQSMADYRRDADNEAT